MSEAPDPSFYEQFVVKRYQHWTLLVEEKQRYLGQAVIWLEREGDMQRLSSLSEDERAELWSAVLPEYESAVQKLWQPDHMNYAWLGNLFLSHKGHGHMHVIPRYATSRTFNSVGFKDTRWGQNYVPYESQEQTIEMAHAVRDALKTCIS
ncbi:MAG TPA: hypothetical protein VG984_01415 [Candidatus Paceibacterota bacterium]|nr:hypothetical protein [Candidatus Paceibacterota bacterium]